MKNALILLCFFFAATNLLVAQTTATSAARNTTPVIKADKDPKPASSYSVTDSKTAAPSCCKKDGAQGKACCAGHTNATGTPATKSCSEASAAPASCSKSATHSCNHAHNDNKPE